MKTTTRKILLSLDFCFALMSARAQYVTIPDTNFVNWLNANGFSGCMMGNQMDTTCSAVVSVTFLNISNANIQDFTGISYFDSVKVFFCYSNLMTSFPNLPSQLNELYCSNNNLTSLPNLPPQLKVLYCSSNNLTSLPMLPSQLQALICDVNRLSSLPTLPPNLTALWTSFNPLDSLPILPASLLELKCDYDSLFSLPPLPPQLLNIYCSYNYLTSIPILPLSLCTLDCFENAINYLPQLPPSLVVLDCWSNQLDSLPILPNSLKALQCFNNHLSFLPQLPDSLIALSCGYNQLTNLPDLPYSLISLSCGYNQLTNLPDLPDSLNSLHIAANPINCLPPIKKIQYFNWSNTGITCLPNIITVNSANPSITTIPICDLFNSNNCHVYWNISGVNYGDTMSNCSIDQNEPFLKNIKLKLFQNGSLIQETFTSDLGQYSFDTDTGTYVYTVDTNSLPFLINCPPSGIQTSVLTIADSMDFNMDFGLQCKPGFDVGVTSIQRTSGRFRPGNNATVNILAGDISNHYNMHCATGVSGTVTVIINGPASYINATAGALTPVVTGNNLVYTISDFGTVNFQNDFSFVVQTDTTAQIGQQVCFDVSVTPLSGDNNTANNNYTQCFTVTNSYDPNEKEVYPSGSIDTSQNELTYTIYFQNTGNDTALHVYLLDTLDSDIDESSIQLLAYSHEPLVQVMGNVVKFNFPNINLPDSTTDEPNSHGYVQYRVRLNDGLVPGTVINNTAYIYFDFNAPVVTNTTFNQIDIITDLTHAPQPPKGEKGAVAEIYPNPVVSGGELKIIFTSPPTPLQKRGEPMLAIFNIYDFSGRNVFAKTVLSAPQTQSIALPPLAAGIYNCVFRYSNGSSHKKLVVINKEK